jgi:hypothetical protein
MLRDVVVHILNEQPIVVDLVSEPTPSDVALICRNLRTLNGKKPVFVDESGSTFILPLAAVRFLEIHHESIEAHEAELAAERAGGIAAAADAELASSALARLDWHTGIGPDRFVGPRELAPVDGSGDGADPDELDGDLLRRIREA